MTAFQIEGDTESEIELESLIIESEDAVSGREESRGEEEREMQRTSPQGRNVSTKKYF